MAAIPTKPAVGSQRPRRNDTGSRVKAIPASIAEESAQREVAAADLIMALYRQSRVKLLENMKKVDTEKGAFFNVKALPVGSVLIFPVALKEVKENVWETFKRPEPKKEEPKSETEESKSETEESESEMKATKLLTDELYLGGLESIGFGRCQVTLAGEGVE